ncbi:MAG TPA: hypothetical protein PLH31_18540 [Caulobacter sp.]|nr:MAG: hypothetical protein B7X77_02835 [Caulobacter sp. 39-67-4]HQR91227.1 hypothetical protein [Caulobacter sp.]
MILALLLMRHAAAVMPRARREWAAGMHAEMLAIPTPAEALVFAAGCVFAAYQQRISPVRIALAIGRFGVTAVTLLTAGVHIIFLLYWLAIINDLKTHGMDSWAGKFPIFQGLSAAEALHYISLKPSWHVGALIAITAAFAISACSLAHRRFKAVVVAAGTGLSINTANALAMQATDGPYLVHHEIAWLYSLAFVLLVLAALVFRSADKRLTPSAPLAV